MNLFSKNTLLILLAVAVIGSFVFSYMQGYFHVQMEYFLVTFLGLFGFFYFVYHRSQKSMDYREAIKRSKDVMENLGTKTSIKRGFAVTDGRRFSKSGKVWDMRAEHGPTETAVFLDKKSGDVVAFDTGANDANSPTQYLWRFQTEASTHYIPEQRIKRKVEEEIKPS